MSDILGKGKASAAEQQKLVEEMERLIKEKGLDAELKMAKRPEAVLRGCAQCTICPCMICW